MTNDGWIAGYVYDCEGQPYDGWRIVAYTTDCPYDFTEGFTDSRGFFNLTLLGDHYYEISAILEIDGIPIVNITRISYIYGGKTTMVDFTYGWPEEDHNTLYLEGYAWDKNHKPLSDVNIAINASGITSEGSTNDIGYYKIEVPGNYFYTITASKEGYRDTVISDVYAHSKKRTMANFTLSPQTNDGWITGHVYNYQGKPVEGIQIFATAIYSDCILVETKMQAEFTVVFPL